MKIALLTGTAYRHVFFANTIMEKYKTLLHVRMKRSNELTDEVSFDASASDLEAFELHSNARLEKEKEYFLPQAEKFIEADEVVEITGGAKELNGRVAIDAFKHNTFDVAIVYGTGLLKKEILEAMPKIVINLHAGLSPYYRGAATLYWPIYFMEPQGVGFTFHLIDLQIDHGEIIHQSRPEIFATDGIHDLGCRTIIQASEDILKVIKKIEDNTIQYYPQKSSGKIFYEADFKPYHLRVTNQIMKNGLLAEYKKFPERFPDPKIIKQV